VVPTIAAMEGLLQLREVQLRLAGEEIERLKQKCGAPCQDQRGQDAPPAAPAPARSLPAEPVPGAPAP
jgi:hypothetical protein